MYCVDFSETGAKEGMSREKEHIERQSIDQGGPPTVRPEILPASNAPKAMHYLY